MVHIQKHTIYAVCKHSENKESKILKTLILQISKHTLRHFNTYRSKGDPDGDGGPCGVKQSLQAESRLPGSWISDGEFKDAERKRGGGGQGKKEWKERRGEERKEEEGHGTCLSLSLSLLDAKGGGGKQADQELKKKDMHVELRVKIVAIKENHRGLCKRIRFWSDDWAVKCVSRQLPVLAHHTRPCKVRRKTADQTTREGDGER